MALPENSIEFSDATPLEPGDLTDDVIDHLHARDMEDVVFWSALRGAARAPAFAAENKYPADLTNDDELFAEVMR